MSIVDYTVLIGTLLLIAAYGVYRTRRQRSIDGYLSGGRDMSWSTIGLSVMATQASAITFISAPGQAFESGLGFVQNYFGLPLALVVVSAFFLPIYYNLKVYTAYEYLEKRFDLRNRMLAAGLFLIQRGLAAGITIYAPSIVLSTLLGWNLSLTILITGLVVVIYTVSGGTKAVSITQKAQMAVILLGMLVAFGVVVYNLPPEVSFLDSLKVAGALNKLEGVNFSFDPAERYTVWSGLLGGFFLSLSYFGTDQSQVQRYLNGKSLREGRIGLMFNALLKIPMQFIILLTGVMVFVFYLFEPIPLVFNEQSVVQAKEASLKTGNWQELEADYKSQAERRSTLAMEYLEAPTETKALELLAADNEMTSTRQKATETLREASDGTSSKDSDYVFLTFILNYMPVGLVGLLLAVILAAAMSSTAGELNALGSTTTVDFYKRFIKPDASEAQDLFWSKCFTAIWGAVAIGFALYARLLENLIEAVNILGSLFYGTILGIFLVAFFLKSIQGTAVFVAAIAVQITILVLYFIPQFEISYLYYNLIGCGGVCTLSVLIQSGIKNPAN